MAQLTSYKQAAAFMDKARKMEKGRPLEVKGWRLFKDGDEFVLNYHSTQVARFLPDNTLRLTLPMGDSLSGGVTGWCHYNIPVAIWRRSTGHYRVHPAVPGSDREYMTAKVYTEFRTGGYRLYDGLTIDLTTRLAVNYSEPTVAVDPERNKDWLRRLKKIKAYLKTVAKLGGFTARIEALQATDTRRWQHSTMTGLHSDDIEFQDMLSALNDGDPEPLVQALAGAMRRHSYDIMAVKLQCNFIDKVFTSNSIALRKALGVINQA